MKVTLKEWKIEDAADLAAALNNKKIQDNLRDGISFPYTKQDAESYIMSVQNADTNIQYAFAVTFGDKVIGSIAVFRKENIHRMTGELGYYIAEQYWGKGIMCEAIKKICDRIFTTTDIVRIFAEPFSRNAASCRVLEKAGFVYEGELKQNAYKNGKFENMKIYALIKNYD